MLPLGAELVRISFASVFHNRTVPRILAGLILALGCLISIESSWGQTVPISSTESVPESLRSFAWDFSRATDKDFDKWPDDWRRYVGVGFPRYVLSELRPTDSKLEDRLQVVDSLVIRSWQSLRNMVGRYPTIQDLPALPINRPAGRLIAAAKLAPLIPTPPSVTDLLSNRYLHIDLDGGQFKCESPMLPATRQHQYLLRCDAFTTGLKHDQIHAELVFFNEEKEELVSKSTNKIGGTTKWTKISIPMVRPPGNCKFMAVRLIVQRSDTGLEDIKGKVGFDNIRIDQYPQLRLTTDHPQGIYPIGKRVEVRATVLGLNESDVIVRFSLLDRDGAILESEQREVMAVNPETQRRENALQGEQYILLDKRDAEETYEANVAWRPSMQESGLYRVIAAIANRSGSELRTETTFAVIDPSLGGDVYGPFGWTLPKSAGEIPPRELTAWLSNLGVAWAKYPCWLEPNDNQSAEQVALMMTRLLESGIETVGMLDSPPKSLWPQFSVINGRDKKAAELFRDVDTWQPLLEPVMSRLALKVRTWQLGSDRDFSFLGRPALKDTIETISTGLQGFGQPIDVSISWPWTEAQMSAGESSWQAVCRSISPSLQADELDAYLDLTRVNRNSGPSTWVLIDPIKKSKYRREDRIFDLVQRMAVVRGHRVEAAWVSDPYDSERGLLRPDGRPDELLLPWRTTARVLGNLRRYGSLAMRGGSQNLVFGRTDRAVLMLWSREPTTEKLYLGEDIKQVDVWGRVKDLTVTPDPVQPYHSISVGPEPIFIVGVDPMLLAFRMSIETTPERFDSLLGEKQTLTVNFKNPTEEPLVGSLRVKTPKSWSIEESNLPWEMLGGRLSKVDIDIVLNNSAKIGVHEVPIQFELETLPPKLITVYRDVTVGPEGLEVELETNLVDRDVLKLSIEMTNNSSRNQAYETLLFAPERQYQSSYIVIRAGETIRRETYWRDAQELIGKQMTLRAREQGGNRILNYSIDVKR